MKQKNLDDFMELFSVAIVGLLFSYLMSCGHFRSNDKRTHIVMPPELPSFHFEGDSK